MNPANDRYKISIDNIAQLSDSIKKGVKRRRQDWGGMNQSDFYNCQDYNKQRSKLSVVSLPGASKSRERTTMILFFFEA